MEKIKIFLTGGSGFIGKNILEQLGNRYVILAPTHGELDLINAEAVYSYLEKNPVDVVINAAAVGVSRKNQTASVAVTNLKIFFNIIRAKSFFKKMIMLGSGAEYGKSRALVRVDEREFDKQVPIDEYGFYKYVCAKYAERVDYITHIRLFGVFGKYEDYETRFISNVICMALFDLPIQINKNVRFDFLFIDDLVKLLEKIIDYPPKEIFLNVGSGEPVETYSIAEKILAKLNKKLSITIRQAGLANEYSANITKLKKYLKYTNFQFTSFDTAVDSLVEYYKKIMPTLNKEMFLTIK